MHLCIIFHGKKRSVTAAFPLWYFCAMFSGLHFLFCFVFSISRDLWCRMMEGIWSVTINRHSAIIFCPIEGWKLTAGNLYATFFARTILHFANFLHFSWFQPILELPELLVKLSGSWMEKSVFTLSLFFLLWGGLVTQPNGHFNFLKNQFQNQFWCSNRRNFFLDYSTDTCHFL